MTVRTIARFFQKNAIARMDHLSDHCIHYTGCKTFISKLTPGMPYNEVMHNIELVFENIDKFLVGWLKKIQLLKQRVEQLEKQLQNGKECTNW